MSLFIILYGCIISGQSAYIKKNLIYYGASLRPIHTPENTDTLKEISLVMAV